MLQRICRAVRLLCEQFGSVDMSLLPLARGWISENEKQPLSGDEASCRQDSWAANGGRHRARLLVFLALTAAALLSLLSLALPSLLIVQAPYDIYIPLDAGLRWLDGVMPSRDYPSPIGPLYALIHGTMLSFDSTDPRSLVRADVLVLGVTYVLLWPVMRGIDKAACASIILLLAAVMMTPLALDAVWISYRYVADYNRWCWGLFNVAMIWTWNPQARDRLCQFALALALCGLFYLKLTMFAGAIGCLALAWICDRRSEHYILPAIILLAAIVAGWVTGFVLPYLTDNIAAGYATGSLRLEKLLDQLVAPYNAVPTTLAVLASFLRRISLKRRLLLLGSIMLLHLTAMQNFDVMIPLIAVPLLLLALDLPRGATGRWQLFTLRVPAYVEAIGLFLVAAVALALQPSLCVAAHVRPTGQPGTIGARIVMPMGSSTGYQADGDLPFANSIVHLQIEKAAELTALLPLGSRVASVETSNIALTAWPHVRPSEGALLWYDEYRTFSENFYLRPEQAFRGADAVLLPLHFPRRSTQHLAALYRPWIERCAIRIAANDLWELYVPRLIGTCGAHPAQDGSISEGQWIIK